MLILLKSKVGRKVDEARILLIVTLHCVDYLVQILNGIKVHNYLQTDLLLVIECKFLNVAISLGKRKIFRKMRTC